MTVIRISLNSEKNGDMTNTAQPASDIPRSWPDPSRLTGKIPGDPNQAFHRDKMFKRDENVQGNPNIRNGDSTTGANGKPTRPDTNLAGGARVNNAVESTHGMKTNALGAPVRFTKDDIMSGGTSLKDLFGDIFGDIFADRRVQRAMVRAADTLDASEAPVAGMSLSKKSKSAKMRSNMLKLVMPELSREQGERLATAIEEHDGETVKKIMIAIGVKLGKQVSRKK